MSKLKKTFVKGKATITLADETPSTTWEAEHVERCITIFKKQTQVAYHWKVALVWLTV